MSEAAHIIERVNIDVDVPDMDTAKHIRDNVSQFLYGTVFPRLETMLSGVSSNRISYRADQLSFDLHFDSKNSFEDQFSARLLEEFNKAIAKGLSGQTHRSSKRNEKEKFETYPRKEKGWQVFIYFLRTGKLPWFVAAAENWLDEKELLAIVESGSVDWRSAFQSLLRSHPGAGKRLMHQFSSKFVITIISRFLEIDLTKNEVLKRLFDENHGPYIQIHSRTGFFFSQVFAFIAGPAWTPQKFAAGFENDLVVMADKISLLEHRDIKKMQEEKKEDALEKDEEDEEGHFVQHAGLILLHPFIQYFFKEFDLLNDKDFKDGSSRKTAVHLLYFLTTGQQHPMEHELLMEKYLCGMYIHEPLERFVELTDSMKQEGDQMLKAVVGHWNALKNTSPDGLREGFLQRDGKLIMKQREQLIIEKKSIDVLLDKLPWGYSIVKLPWMKKELYVDWNES
jgi:hypothetical protein